MTYREKVDIIKCYLQLTKGFCTDMCLLSKNCPKLRLIVLFLILVTDGQPNES